jgi:hypothetical protein
VSFETIFKVLATFVVMLPMVLMGALVFFIFEMGICFVIILVLYVTGFLPDIPNWYVNLGLCGLMVVAIGYVGVAASRYGPLLVRK